MLKFGTPQVVETQDEMIKVGAKKFGNCCYAQFSKLAQSQQAAVVCDCGNELVMEHDSCLR